MSADPLNGNRYALTGANPINFVEFDGHLLKDEPGIPGPGSGTQPRTPCEVWPDNPACKHSDGGGGGGGGGGGDGGGGDGGGGKGTSGSDTYQYCSSDACRTCHADANGVTCTSVDLPPKGNPDYADIIWNFPKRHPYWTTAILLLLGGRGGRDAVPGDSGRLPRDIGVNPVAPRPLPLSGRPISSSATQNGALKLIVGQLRKAGATDIRVNQQQVDINGARVGINRPDLQFTVNGERVYIEIETSGLEAALAHRARILANDPSGVFVPAWIR